jgi:hypothetical protein
MAHSYRIFRSWIWELLSLAVSIGLIVAIAVLLATYNGKPAPDWGYHINLNALLALLSTILRAMVVVVLAQIISQRKWEWYGGERARPLSDLQQFDTGSRGAWGAILLIPTVVLKDFVTLVAAVVLGASFLVGPFVQQASRTTECSFPQSTPNASIPFAHYVPGRGDEGWNGIYGDDRTAPNTAMAILMSATAPDSVDNQVKPSCITGNCTFPIGDPQNSRSARRSEDAVERVVTTHSTVGMCNKCTDVTSLIFVPSDPTQYNNTRFDVDPNFSDSGDVANYTASTTVYNYTSYDTVFALPNDITVNYYEGSSSPVRIKPSKDLEWMGEMLTPELRALSRWSYVNATFLATESVEKDNGTAAVCVLYPCLRTYTASVTNNQLVEKLVRSEPMQISLNESLIDIQEGEQLPPSGQSTLQNDQYDFVAVKSPCRVGDAVYEMPQDGKSNVPGVSVSLYDFTNKGGSTPKQSSHRNISAPAQCIYRQNGKWTSHIANLLHTDVFDGTCVIGRGQMGCTKTQQDLSSNGFSLGDMGVSPVLRALAQNSSTLRVKPYPEIAHWFDSFADAMTNRFRFQFGIGSSVWEVEGEPLSLGDSNTSPPPHSPMGEARGLAWQSTVCIAMHWEWLLLPIALTFITTLLSIWTIISNWRHRRTRPVWKDNILPLLFYGHRMESTEYGPTVSQPPRDHGIHTATATADQTHTATKATDQASSLLSSPTTPFSPTKPSILTVQEHSVSSSSSSSQDTDSILLESAEMKRISHSVPITFHWPNSDSHTHHSTALQQEKHWLTRRTPQQQREGDSLLGTDSDVEATAGNANLRSNSIPGNMVERPHTRMSGRDEIQSSPGPEREER